MSLFLDAAVCWNNLLNTSYIFVIGHKKTSVTLNLCFRPVDFDHLSGIHYASDVDFKLHRNEYRGDQLTNAVISSKIDSTLIEKSINWERISKRLQDVIYLEKILDSDFRIYRFNPAKLNFYSEIKANYLIYSELYRMGVFLFIDRDNHVDYCKSIFTRDERDYTLNQTKWTMLKKVKCHSGVEEVLYVSASYREQE